MRTITKEVEHEIDGTTYKFQIKKMDALHGSYLIKFCTEKLLPMMSLVQELLSPISKDASEAEVSKIAEKRTNMILEEIPNALASLSEDEMIKFEMRCLGTVSMLKPAGWQPVMIGKSFGVEELEYDPATVLLLCYQVVAFNLKDFFQGKGLGSLLSRLNSFQPGA